MDRASRAGCAVGETESVVTWSHSSRARFLFVQEASVVPTVFAMTEAYRQLYTRNNPIIPVEVQRGLSELQIGVAGCGSTGGAFVDGALRLGIQRFHLCDNGEYELSNLNRQMVSRQEVDMNKAEAYGRRVQNVNSESQVQVWREGLSEDNVDDFLSGLDFVFDAVDVTTVAGMEMKLKLHEKAHQNKIPTGSALDLGYTQWLQSYNYHLNSPLLLGKFREAKAAKNPLKALIVGFSPVKDLPLEISQELIRLLREPNASACQMASVCFLLSAMVSPYLMFFVRHQKLPELKEIDLTSFFESESEKQQRAEKTRAVHLELEKVLREIE